MVVFMQQNIIQALIEHSKQQIRELELEREYIQHLINTKYWPNSIPFSNSVVSHKNFEMLNRAKDDIRAICKKIKLLAEVQYSLKTSIR